jgi:hypothetical protein
MQGNTTPDHRSTDPVTGYAREYWPPLGVTLMGSHCKPLPPLFSLLLLLSVSCSETDAYLDEDLGLVSMTAGTFLMGGPEDELARETDAYGTT